MTTLDQQGRGTTGEQEERRSAAPRRLSKKSLPVPVRRNPYECGGLVSKDLISASRLPIPDPKS